MKISSENIEMERLREEVRRLQVLLHGTERIPETVSAASLQVAEQALELASSREEIGQQARLFDTVLSSIVDFAYVFDREGRITYANQALLNLWQRERKDTLGKNFFELGYPAELAARLQQQIQGVFDTGQTLRDETAFTSAEGIPGYYEYILVPVFDTGGRVEVVAGSTRDITARQREKAEKEELVRALEVERARLTELFMQAPAFIAILRGPRHVFERVNVPYLHLVDSRDVIGKTVREAFPEIEGQGFFEILDEVYRTGKPFVGKDIRMLIQAENAELRERYLDFVYQPLLEADGSASGIFVQGIDLTDRKATEESLRQRQAEIETLNRRLQRAVTETHHRVKNNLQMVSALIDLQKQDRQDMVPMSEIVRLGHNIQALVVIHDILTLESRAGGNVSVVSVKSMFEQFLLVLESTLGGRRLLSRLEELPLPGNHVTALAFIANELVSNAVKHGTGDVEFTLSTHGGRATLEVCDDGPGFPVGFDPETAAHTGLELIESIVRHDLRGTVSYRNGPQGGARVMLTFPIPNLPHS